MNTARLHAFSDLYRLHLKPWTASVVLFPLCAYFALTDAYTFLDHADLMIHEAGHFFFAMFGRFLHIAGGTIMQLLLPLVLAVNFLLNRYRIGMQIMLLWLGQSCLNVSVYAADARARQLPLLGGDNAGHDWWNMLGMLGLLEYDGLIATVFYGCGLVVFAALLAAPLYLGD